MPIIKTKSGIKKLPYTKKGMKMAKKMKAMMKKKKGK